MLKKLLFENKFRKIIFITGGTKSGKSEFAEYLGKKLSNLTYIALSEKRPEDDKWQEKIKVHRERRPKEWKVIETTDLLDILNTNHGPLLIDSIGGYIMEHIHSSDEVWAEKINLLIYKLKTRKCITLIVGEQVGWGLVSEYKIGNLFIERLGMLQKELTHISNENWLTLNGRAIKLDKISLEIPI